METAILEKEKLSSLKDKLASRYAVFGPVNNEGIISFSSLTKHDLEIDMMSVGSPKSILFAQMEQLLKYTTDERGNIGYVEESSQQEDKPAAILGIRPCDARSFTMLDKVFYGDYEDPNYLRRRKDALLIGLSCQEPRANCFCTSLDGEPYHPSGMDILLSDLGETYYAEVISDQGKEILQEASDLFTDPTDKDKKKKEEDAKRAISKMPKHFEVTEVSSKLEDIFQHHYWEKVAAKCLGCGICTYLCPTCHCFDVQDQKSNGQGVRIRTWDSCMYPEYTLQASGYNPRPGRMNRVRNRIYHKYQYMPENYQVIGCVGCGRCIEHCPTNVDIIEILKGALEV